MKEESIIYNLPENWAEEAVFSFDHLSELVQQLHDSAYSATVRAINRFATIRNYVIGFYIVEYEQHGNDRANYGERLLKRLAERVDKKGINETLLKNCRRFYSTYPQIKDYLTGQVSATQSHNSAICPTASDQSLEKSPTTSDKFGTPAFELISKLSFSHIVELLFVDDPLARFFYETECIRCCWSVKELRRQISTNLFFRAGVSKSLFHLFFNNRLSRAPCCTDFLTHHTVFTFGGVEDNRLKLAEVDITLCVENTLVSTHVDDLANHTGTTLVVFIESNDLALQCQLILVDDGGIHIRTRCDGEPSLCHLVRNVVTRNDAEIVTLHDIVLRGEADGESLLQTDIVRRLVYQLYYFSLLFVFLFTPMII